MRPSWWFRRNSFAPSQAAAVRAPYGCAAASIIPSGCLPARGRSLSSVFPSNCTVVTNGNAGCGAVLSRHLALLQRWDFRQVKALIKAQNHPSSTHGNRFALEEDAFLKGLEGGSAKNGQGEVASPRPCRESEGQGLLLLSPSSRQRVRRAAGKVTRRPLPGERHAQRRMVGRLRCGRRQPEAGSKRRKLFRS